jgi:drug/metabolite transporter (DMT)-like permease
MFLEISEESKGAFSLVGWQVTNITMVLLNKFLLSYMEFGFPVILGCIHMIVCIIGANLFLSFTESKDVKSFDWKYRLTKVLPLAFLFVGNLILGNASLKLVTVSLMQTIKTTVPAFTVILQVVFLSKRFPAMIYISLIPTICGVMLASWSEPTFDMRGFWAAVLSSVMTACISVVSGLLLSVKIDSMNLLNLMAPLCLMLLLPATVLFGEIEPAIVWYHEASWHQMILLCISGCLAFTLNIFNLLMIAYTSPLTANIAGNLKSVFSIVLSVIIFHNTITLINAVGIMIAIGGVALYNHAVTSTPKKEVIPIHEPINKEDINDSLPTIDPNSAKGAS